MTISKTQVLHSYSEESIHFHPTPMPPSAILSPVVVNNEIVFNLDRVSKSPKSGNDTPSSGVGISPRTSIPPGDESPEDKKLTDICWSVCNRTVTEKYFPVLRWLPNYTTKMLVSDFIAGITVGLTILPQGLAYATVAGLPPIYGLYSSVFGPLVYIIFGSTKVVTIGPNAIQCILTFKFLAGRSPEYAVFYCFTSGLIMTIIAVLRLGFITHFISYPVITAFTSAVALTTMATQVKALLGIQFEDEGFLPTLIGLSNNITNIHKYDTILSLVCCTLLIFLANSQRLFRKLSRNTCFDKLIWLISTSRNAIVISTCTIIAASISSDEVFTLVGKLPAGLPDVKPPPISIDGKGFFQLVREECSAIFILALLGLMGHITIAKAFSGSSRVHATQESLALGITNLLSSFFSSMPIAGSFSRTTINAFSGAESPLGGLVTGVMVTFALQFLTPYFFFIPKASLASVVITSMVYMVDFSIVPPLWRSKKMDLLPWMLTFVTTLFVGVEYGILTGLVVSAVFLLYYAARPRVKVIKGETTLRTEFVLVVLDRSLTYPSVDYVTDIISASANIWGDMTPPIVIDCHHIQFMDFTAAKALSDMVHDLRMLNHKTIFYKAKPSVIQVMNGILLASHEPFIHCQAEYEMEESVDAYRFGNGKVV